MKKLILYLDNCCFNRPYDVQSNIKVQLETAAKLFIQSKINQGEYLLIWSYILDYENEFNPFRMRKEEIIQWKKRSNVFIKPNEIILNRAEKYLPINIKMKDALHIACAIEAKADYLITTDNLMNKKNHLIENINIINPIHFIEIMEV